MKTGRISQENLHLENESNANFITKKWILKIQEFSRWVQQPTGQSRRGLWAARWEGNIRTEAHRKEQKYRREYKKDMDKNGKIQTGVPKSEERENMKQKQLYE